MSDEKENVNNKKGITRRDWLKAAASIPVFGAFGISLYNKWISEKDKKQKVLKALGLDKINHVNTSKTNASKNDLIRVGIIGFGVRGEQIARALGFALPDWIETQKENNNLESWLQQEDLNIAITGICDVFDLHAEKGISASECEFRSHRIKAKRFRNHREMLESKDIDAVVITTPDFHHAQMTIDAVNAGKHVYCEKCMTRTEEEIFEVERAVKNNNVVFQLGHQYTKNAAYIQAQEVIRRNTAGKITLIETTTNRNSPHGAWVRHTNPDGSLKPGNSQNIDWKEWLGNAPQVPFSVDRFYNWTKWWDYATGLSGQLMSHELDLANQLLCVGIPHSCTASGGIYFYKDNREIPDIFHAVFEYPEKDLTLIYSASLASEYDRGRIFMGHDATIKLGNTMEITIDPKSTQFKDQIKNDVVDTSQPAVVFNPAKDKVDAVTTATEKFYASSGLFYTYRDGKRVDTTFLHLKEWLNGIRHGTPVSVPIEKGVEATVACHMATRSYLEKRTVYWDSVKRKIV